MRTTVTLDDGVYQAAMHLSRSSGERLGKVLSSLARRGLVPRLTPPKRSSRRFPTFEVPPDAPVIPASRIERVIDEEGLFQESVGMKMSTNVESMTYKHFATRKGS